MALVPREPTGRDAHQKASQQVLMRERGDPGGSQAQAGATAGGTQEADSRSRASGCRAGKGSQMTKPRSCDQRLLPATQSLSHRLWAFRGQRGPWQVWEEPHSQGGPRRTAGNGHGGESKSVGISRSHCSLAQRSPIPVTLLWKPTALGKALSGWRGRSPGCPLGE